ncbi:Jag family protein [Brachybacterium sp. AOP42-C2-15]|uniref:Jag family protein n=1 Tax=Brachybacterium sp. AOP42-C2-15 TaxID=3457670 RepID=UPI003FD9971A
MNLNDPIADAPVTDEGGEASTAPLEAAAPAATASSPDEAAADAPASDMSAPDATAPDESVAGESAADESAADDAVEAEAALSGSASADSTPVEGDEQSSEDPEDPEATVETTEERMRRLEEEGDIAADYLEELLDIADLDGDIDIDVDGDRASVEIAGADKLARLNRPKGELLDALQELTRLAVQTRTGNRSRLMLDIGGFRAEHKGSLEGLAATAIAEAKESGEPVSMRPMNPFERKVVHDVAKREGLRSESDGDGKNRHVVIYPAS